MTLTTKTATNATQPLNFEAIADQLPPQNIQAEEAILGGLLLDPNAIGRVAGKLEPAHFYVSAHAKLYAIALELQSQGQPVDLISTATALSDRGELEAIGGQARLVQLLDRTVSSVNIDQYAALVIDKFNRRQLIQAGREITALGFDTTAATADCTEQAEQKIFALSSARPSQTGAYNNDVVTDVFEQIEQRMNSDQLSGLPTGFYDFDNITGGLQAGSLVLVAGRPSMGKTSWAMQVAYETAIGKHGEVKPVCVFSLEMSKEEVVQRQISLQGEISGSSLKSGKLTEAEMQKFYDAMVVVGGASLYTDDRPNPSVTEMSSTARQVAAEKGQLGAIVIDYVQLMGGDGSNRVQELAQISRQLKGLAREMNCPVILLSQLSRRVEERNNKRPMMSDLRDSGALEQDADLILMLYRDEYYNPDTPDRGIAEVIIAKHRNGPTGTVKLLFDGQYTKFKNLAYGQPGY